MSKKKAVPNVYERHRVKVGGISISYYDIFYQTTPNEAIERLKTEVSYAVKSLESKGATFFIFDDDEMLHGYRPETDEEFNRRVKRLRDKEQKKLQANAKRKATLNAKKKIFEDIERQEYLRLKAKYEGEKE
jgi:hypothetical protein